MKNLDSIQDKKLTCYKCGGEGHMSRECTQLGNNSNSYKKLTELMTFLKIL